MKVLILASVFCLGAAALDDGVVRRYAVTVDGENVGAAEVGKAFEFACAHADGKKHTVTLKPAPLSVYRADGMEFPFPSECSVTRKNGEVRIDHADTRYPYDIMVTPLEEEVTKENVGKILVRFQKELSSNPKIKAEGEELDEKMGKDSLGARLVDFTTAGLKFRSRVFVVAKGERKVLVVLTCVFNEEEKFRGFFKRTQEQFRLVD